MGDLSNNFSRSELSCRDHCGFDTVDAMLLVVLEDIRDNFDAPVRITSGCRCAVHNAAVGGTPLTSQHLVGRAADITVDGVSPSEVQGYLLARYPDCFGVGSYDRFSHIDTRSGPAARWQG